MVEFGFETEVLLGQLWSALGVVALAIVVAVSYCVYLKSIIEFKIQ